jgi:hypothetical protein
LSHRKRRSEKEEAWGKLSENAPITTVGHTMLLVERFVEKLKIFKKSCALKGCSLKAMFTNEAHWPTLVHIGSYILRLKNEERD